MRIAIALAAMLAGATASFADDDIAAGSRAICYASGVRIGEATMSAINTDREIQEWMSQRDDDEAMDVILSHVAKVTRTFPQTYAFCLQTLGLPDSGVEALGKGVLKFAREGILADD